MPYYHPKYIEAAATWLSTIREPLRDALDNVTADIAERQARAIELDQERAALADALAKAKDAGKRAEIARAQSELFAKTEQLRGYRMTMLLEKQKQLRAEFTKLEAAIKKPTGLPNRTFWGNMLDITVEKLPPASVPAFKATVRATKAAMRRPEFWRTAVGKGAAYSREFSLFTQMELWRPNAGLYNYVPRKFADEVEGKLRSMIFEGKPYGEFVREMVPVYRVARENWGAEPGRLFSVNDRGDIGNAVRAAANEMNYASFVADEAYAREDPDVVGIIFNFDGACPICTGVLSGPRGDGSFLFGMDEPIPQPNRDTHIGCDCFVEGWVYRDDRRYMAKAFQTERKRPVRQAGEDPTTKPGGNQKAA
jgi:hypothetical protein